MVQTVHPKPTFKPPQSNGDQFQFPDKSGPNPPWGLLFGVGLAVALGLLAIISVNWWAANRQVKVAPAYTDTVLVTRIKTEHGNFTRIVDTEYGVYCLDIVHGSTSPTCTTVPKEVIDGIVHRTNGPMADVAREEHRAN